VLQAHNAQTLRTVLEQVEHAARNGYWCVGGLRYEAASALHPELQTHAAQEALAWFAVFEAPPASLAKAPVSTSPDLPALHWQAALQRDALWP